MEGPSKRDASSLTGRTDTMKRVVFPDVPMAEAYGDSSSDAGAGAHLLQAQPGDYVAVEVRIVSWLSVCTLSCRLQHEQWSRCTLQMNVHGVLSCTIICVPV